MATKKAGGKASKFARSLERGGSAPALPEPVEAVSGGSAEKKTTTTRRARDNGRRVVANPDAKEKRVRITVDASREQHRRLKIFAMDAETDAMSVVRALLDEMNENPGLAGRIRDRLAEG